MKKYLGLLAIVILVVGVFSFSASCDLFNPPTTTTTAYNWFPTTTSTTSTIATVVATDLVVGAAYSTETITRYGTKWFRFPVSSGTSYAITWEDSYQKASGNTSVSADVYVTGYKSDQVTTYFTSTDSGYLAPATLIATENTYAYLKVVGSWAAGTFQIKVSVYTGPTTTTTTLPVYQEITLGAATNGTLNAGQNNYYKFPIVSDISYSVTWEDSFDKEYGNSFPTVDIRVTCYKSDLIASYFAFFDDGYSLPQQFYATETGYAYLKVQPYYTNGFGNFQIKAALSGSGSIGATIQ